MQIKSRASPEKCREKLVTDSRGESIQSVPKRTMNVALNRLWISNLNLRPYTLSILMWSPTKFKSNLQAQPSWPPRRPLLCGIADRKRQQKRGRERETEIRIWIVYKTINEHIYFMFMLIFFFEFDKTQHKNFSFRFVFMLMSVWGGGGSQGCSVAGSGWLDRQLITIIDGGNYHHRSS